MGTAPVKSHQPLHNFSLSFLKWGQKNQTKSNQRCLRFSESSRDSPPPPLPSTANHRRYSSPGPDSETESENRKVLFGSRSARNRFPLSSCSSQKRQAVVLERESGERGGDGEKLCDDGETEESMAKPWNLRPRKAIAKDAAEVGAVSSSKNEESPGGDTAVQQSENLPKSMRLRGFAEGQGLERQEKKNKFWISLSREEIEEDVYALTGSRPARRPKKRPRTVQKQVDNVFPGLYLVGITADSYRVHETLR